MFVASETENLDFMNDDAQFAQPAGTGMAPLTPSLSPSDGERVASGRVRCIRAGYNTDPNQPLPRKPTTVVYACSGCSDAGELADRIARRLTQECAAQMSCLAGIGGRVKGLVSKAEKAEHILVVDGCPLNCAAHTLRLAGFRNFDHLELQKIGMRKGFCPVTEERIASGVEAAKEILSKETAAEPRAELVLQAA